MAMFSAPKGVPEYFPPESQAFLAVREALGAPARSAGYGYTVGRNILCAYLPVEDAIHTNYDIEAMGERYTIVRHSRPLHDPDRKRILA